MRKNVITLMLVLGLAFLLAACQTSGPQKTLNAAAQALTEKNSQNFMAQIDMDAFASHELVNLKQDNSLLSFAGDLGALFGFGNRMDQWLESAMDLKSQYTRTFTRMVSSGELVAQCTRSQSPDCPWEPGALKKAKVVEIDDTAAVAQVTTPANMTSWLALRKEGDTWYIVGKAVLEEQARKFATNTRPILSQETEQEQAPAAPEQPKAPEKPAPEASGQSTI